MASDNQKVILITGCSSGIGLVTAVMLAKDAEKRFKVYATMRNTGKKEMLESEGKDVLGTTLFIEKLDVASEEEINKTVDSIIAKEGRLDILLNNAGFGWFGPTEKHESSNMEAMFATNVFGPMKLIRKLIPIWKKAGSGHALTVTSIGGLMGFPFSSVYVATKFAMEGFMESAKLELAPYPNIKMTAIEPGPVLTHFAQNAQVGNLEAECEGLDEPSANAMKKMKDSAAESFKECGQKGEDVAKIILEAITAENPHQKYMTNPKYENLLTPKYVDLTGNAGFKAASDWFKLL